MENREKKFIITGAGFSNMGAQAMLFATICELKNRFPDAEIKVINSTPLPAKYQGKIKFEYVESGMSEYYAIARLLARIKINLKNIIKICIRKNVISNKIFEQEIRKTDVIIDISGFALGEQWSDVNCLKFLARIEMAKKYGKPIYLMPQSFGPFNFKGKNRKFILDEIKKILSYPKIIFAREMQGFNLLVNQYNLSNVKKSIDLVLQTPKEKIDLLLEGYYGNTDFFNDVEEESVAIIPNIHCYEYLKGKLVSAYKDIIEYLRGINKNVYVIKHSEADAVLCKEIINHFKGMSKVEYIDYTMNCYEFSDFISRFRYAIASRYHSIVHAYKVGVPCIAIGWSFKYNELLKLFGQAQYACDVRDEFNAMDIIQLINKMEKSFITEKKRILFKSNELRENNCFDILEASIKKEVINV